MITSHFKVHNARIQAFCGPISSSEDPNRMRFQCGLLQILQIDGAPGELGGV